MRKILLFIIGFFLSFQTVNCQEIETITRGRAQFRKIIELIRNNDLVQLADLIQYPLERPDPIPNIKTKDEFILYYPTLFDDLFRQWLLDTTRALSSAFRDPHSFFVGLFQGEIYVNEDGLINRINYSSKKEIELRNVLEKEVLTKIHPSITNCMDPVLFLKSDNYIIMIDLLDDHTARYSSWSIPKRINDKPDLIIYHGTYEYQGNMGSIIYTFKNGDWTYIVDYRAFCSDIEDCGFSLRLYQNNIERKSIKMTKIKNGL